LINTRKNYEKNRKRRAPQMWSKLMGWLVTFAFPFQLRSILLRLAGARIGRKVYIGHLCVFDDTFIELITIEDNVAISSGSIIVCHDSSTKEGTVGDVIIKKGAYLGVGARILPGITIGENSIVGAGAVVTKDVAPDSVVVGIPARPIERSTAPKFAREIKNQD
jgi:acetyltransferase-like isoleucine patch superfamily enzyme